MPHRNLGTLAALSLAGSAAAAELPNDAYNSLRAEGAYRPR